MVAGLLEATLSELSDIQREAVEWNDGSMLVLAGLGSGKTRVLTCRVARILSRSPDERFRVLALTFTNKVAREMESRVADLVPDIAERSDIDTFHGFCAQVLRQHGVHLGIKSDFAIYSQTSDRQAVLEDALRRESGNPARSDMRVLPLIDVLKTRLVSSEQAEDWLVEGNVVTLETARRTARVYRLYEDELRRANALDFNSLIFGAYKLFGYPGLVRHYRTVYRYWMIDEFQDTNDAQYKLLRRMAGDDFRRVFAVADDDQTIYEWNGADVRRISTLVEDFDCEVVQLPTNFRCPPRIVEAANRLIVYNTRRRGSKRPAKSAPRNRSTGRQQIQCSVFETDEDEAAGIAAEIGRQDIASRGRTLVLARTRALLESIYEALKAEDVSAAILKRRDDFASPQMRWLVACLKQLHRPLDRHNMAVLLKTFDCFAARPLNLDLDELVSRSTAEGAAYLTVWTHAARAADPSAPDAGIVDAISDLAAGETKHDTAIQRILELFETADNGDESVADDLSAWRRLSSEIGSSLGSAPLDRFLQEVELRSKEPVPPPGAVSLATIHSAKDLEFDIVYLTGLAEEVLPSWHSVKDGNGDQGNGGAALEEERRGCFVAITRTKKQLILSRAREYRGWPKQPSRFLKEMRLCGETLHE